MTFSAVLWQNFCPNRETRGVSHPGSEKCLARVLNRSGRQSFEFWKSRLKKYANMDSSVTCTDCNDVLIFDLSIFGKSPWLMVHEVKWLISQKYCIRHMYSSKLITGPMSGIPKSSRQNRRNVVDRSLRAYHFIIWTELDYRWNKDSLDTYTLTVKVYGLSSYSRAALS